MAESTTAELQQILQEGRAAALAGDTMVARAHFRRATELEPTCAEAWLGLSSVVPVLSEKREYLRRALEHEPDSAEAQASLHYVEKLLDEGLQIAPSRRREERAASGDASPLLAAPEPAAVPAVEHCYRHPDRETGLHCVQCARPICGACAQPTPVGQLCPECRRQRRPRNYQVSAGHMLAGGLVALFTAGLVSIPVAMFLGGFGFFSLFLLFLAGPAIAEFIVRVVDYATKLKRGRGMQVAVGAGIVLGTLPMLLLTLNIFLLVFMFIAVATATARLR